MQRLAPLPEPVKRGQVHPKDYQNDEYYGKLGPLIAALNEEVPDAKYDAKTLVYTLVQILHFQEAALGREAMPPRPAPKLPIKLITDPAVGGGLHAIALKLQDIRRSRGLKVIEWQNPGKRKECLEVLVMLRRELERRQLLQTPLVHVSPRLGPEMQRLREYVRRLQGNLAESEREPGVTHVVHPFGPGGDPDDGNEYTTVIAAKGDRARVHYWYQPDSYDEWIPLDSVDNKEAVPERAPPGGRWKVTPRWIIDSEKFNEWMNPADYTTPDFEAELEAAEAAAGGGKEGKRGGGALTGPSKKQRQDGSRPEVAAEPLSQLAAHVVMRRLLHPHKGLSDPRGTSCENLSMGQTNTHMAAHLPGLPPPAPLPPGQQPPPPAELPAFACWFDPDSVSDMERAAVPDFFNGRCPSRTPEVYQALRDGIIRVYCRQPGCPLTFLDVKRQVPGEVNSLRRIYEFLDSWGVINCGGLSPEAAAARRPVLPPTGRQLAGRMPPGDIALFDFQRPSRLEASAATQQGGTFTAQPLSGGAAARGDTRGAAPGSLLSPGCGRRGTDSGLHPGATARLFCSAMPWVDCTLLRYHCSKYPDVNLCPKAFAAGRFPPGCSSRDFVRVDARQRPPSSDGWRPEETMLLLEGLELYKEDWAAIAAHVGTRSQAACLMHFVRLPIEDGFIDELAGISATPAASAALTTAADDTAAAPGQAAAADSASAAASAASGGVKVGADGLPPLPFLEEPNPLMATVGFLAVVMGPRVAAAAAQRALQVLVEGDEAAGAALHPKLSALVAAAEKQAAAAAAGEGEGEGGGQAANGDGSSAAVMMDVDGVGAGAAPAAAVDPGRPVSRSLVLSATAAGLAAAAVRAKQLGAAEEREITRLMVSLVDSQMRKVDAKEKSLAELGEQALDKERQAAEASLPSLAAEAAQLALQRKKAEAAKAARQQQAAKHKAHMEQQQKKQAAEAHKQQQQQQQQAAAARQQQQQQPAQEVAPALKQEPGPAAPVAAAPAAAGPAATPAAAAPPAAAKQQPEIMIIGDDDDDDDEADMP